MRFSLFCFLVFACLFSACFEPKEGCLDIAAVNFDANADKNCCCTYPNLKFVVDQRYDTLPFRRDSVFPGQGGRPFRLHDVAFYLSEFQLLKAGAVFSVSDTQGLRVFQANGNDTLRQVFQNDFQLVRLETQEYTIGRFREDGSFSGAKIRLGLSTDANRVIAPLAPASHPLSVQTDSLWQGKSKGFVYLKVVVSRDTLSTSARDTLYFTRADLGDFLIEAKNTALLHPTGYDFRVRLTADYQKLLGNVDWSSGSPSTWKNQIVANLPTVFSISQ